MPWSRSRRCTAASRTRLSLPPTRSIVRDHDALRRLCDVDAPGARLCGGRPGVRAGVARMWCGQRLEIVTSVPPAGMSPQRPLAELEAATPSGAVDDAHAGVTGDTIAKVLFTSGSTGRPKGVINTQRMLCANQEQIRTVLAFLADAPPVLCDWLPWNHTFGGNHNFGIVLYNGGTLYIDEGRPVPGQWHARWPTCARSRRPRTSTCRGDSRCCCRRCAHDADFRRAVLQPPAAALLCRRRPAAGDRRRDAGARGRDAAASAVPWITGLGATESAPFARVHRRAAFDARRTSACPCQASS